MFIPYATSTLNIYLQTQKRTLSIKLTQDLRLRLQITY